MWHLLCVTGPLWAAFGLALCYEEQLVATGGTLLFALNLPVADLQKVRLWAPGMSCLAFPAVCPSLLSYVRKPVKSSQILEAKSAFEVSENPKSQ